MCRKYLESEKKCNIKNEYKYIYLLQNTCTVYVLYMSDILQQCK